MQEKINIIKEKYKEKIGSNPDANVVQEKIRLLREKYREKFGSTADKIKLQQMFQSKSFDSSTPSSVLSPKESESSQTEEFSSSAFDNLPRNDKPPQMLSTMSLDIASTASSKYSPRESDSSLADDVPTRKVRMDMKIGNKDTSTSQNIDSLMRRKMQEITKATARCLPDELEISDEGAVMPVKTVIESRIKPPPNERDRTGSVEKEPEYVTNKKGKAQIVSEVRETPIIPQDHSQQHQQSMKESKKESKILFRKKSAPEVPKADVEQFLWQESFEKTMDKVEKVEMDRARRDLDEAEKINQDLVEYLEKQEKKMDQEKKAEGLSHVSVVRKQELITAPQVVHSAPVIMSVPKTQPDTVKSCQIATRADDLQPDILKHAVIDTILSSPTSKVEEEITIKETQEERRQRLMREDSFNRPESPEPNPMPLPKESVIKRHRLHRTDSSSDTDSQSSSQISPRLSPRARRKMKKPGRSDKPRHHLDVPKLEPFW